MSSYKNISTLALCIARSAVVHNAAESGRLISWVTGYPFTETDFTEIYRIAANVADVLKSADGREWGGVLSDLHAVCGSLPIEKGRGEIIATCANCGVCIV